MTRPDKDLSPPAPDDEIVLFAKARRIYPKAVEGFFRRLKWAVMAVLLGIYYLTPFLRWDRGPNAPDQAILIDMEGRRAYFFFIEIWPQEVYYFAGLLILAAVALFFITALLGRVWCGYACPQTVWTDLFVAVERFFQGDHVARQRLDKAPLSFTKIWKKGATHITWLLIGLFTGGAWTLYFTDAPTLVDDILHLSVPWKTCFWIYGLTLSTYIMAGFAREQVCTYMCPYSRFQSGMFDKDSLIITYDAQRGEPRGAHKKGESWEGRGHCIDCRACVAVCPVGIDIRDGLQYQCIACGLCVDACNDIMRKVELPEDLIKYDTSTSSAQPLLQKMRLIRPRTVFYAVIIVLVSAIMLFGLLTRAPTILHVLHERNPLYVQLSDGRVRNSYKLHILNHTRADQRYTLSVEGVQPASLHILGAQDVPVDSIPVMASGIAELRITLAAAKDEMAKRKDITFVLKNNADGHIARTKNFFVSGK